MNKYHAVRTEIDGIKFASRIESQRYAELKLLERAGEIRDLELQPRFPLIGTRGPLRFATGRTATYVADFSYVDRGGAVVIEDCKGLMDRGPATRLFELKRALMADRGLAVTVVTKGKR